MEVYKLGKIIENQEIKIHLILHSLEEAREELRKSLKRRKDIAKDENGTQYKEINTAKVFANGDSKEFDATIVDLMEKNKAQAKEIRTLNIEQESQTMMLCEVIEQQKRVIEDKAMIEDDKRNLDNRLEEKSIELARISNMQLDTLSQMMNAHHELNVKDIEITTLKLQNEQLQSDLRREREIVESFNKPNKAIKYFEKLMKSPRSNNDTLGLGYTRTEEGESSKSVEERNDKGKNSKPTCHFCGKKGHTAKWSKNVNHHDKSKNMVDFHKCNKQGHQEPECKSRTMHAQRFEGDY